MQQEIVQVVDKGREEKKEGKMARETTKRRAEKKGGETYDLQMKLER